MKEQLPSEISSRERQEIEMKESFMTASQGILRSEDRFIKDGTISTRIGLEVEYSLLTTGFTQASEEQRDAIIKENPDCTDVELGASQLELRTPPYDLTGKGITGFAASMHDIEDRIRVSAKRQGALILRDGVNPLVWVQEIRRTNKEKYQQVPDFHNQNRKKDTNTLIGVSPNLVDTGDAAVIALCNSVQCNLEAKDFNDAIDKLNRSLMISPFIVGLCANARFIADRDTGLRDLRNIAWEVSHDTRTPEERNKGALTRVGLPGHYYSDMQDYFDQISQYPFILYNPPAALQIGIGLNWRDARIKLIEDSLVVEFRPVSTQPTVDENLAAMLFYTGRLGWSQITNEPLLDFSLVRANKEMVMRYGVQGYLWTTEGNHILQAPALEVLEKELGKAKKGMEMLGFDNQGFSGFFELLESRFSKGIPADKMAKAVYTRMQQGFKSEENLLLHDALILALNEMKVV